MYKENARCYNKYVYITKSLPRLRYGGYPNPEVLYILIRRIRPKILVETGVSFGVTSSFILQALEDNGEGKLYSIDLTFQFAKENETGSLVPIRLRHRWKLILGDSKTELPSLLNDLKRIDLFFHDSLHTYEHMMFEYRLAWKYLKKGGYLISDDIHLNNTFIDFCSAYKATYFLPSTNLGIVKK